jgi:hypothetical protein
MILPAGLTAKVLATGLPPATSPAACLAWPLTTPALPVQPLPHCLGSSTCGFPLQDFDQWLQGTVTGVAGAARAGLLAGWAKAPAAREVRPPADLEAADCCDRCQPRPARLPAPLIGITPSLLIHYARAWPSGPNASVRRPRPAHTSARICVYCSRVSGFVLCSSSSLRLRPQLKPYSSPPFSHKHASDTFHPPTRQT